MSENINQFQSSCECGLSPETHTTSNTKSTCSQNVTSSAETSIERIDGSVLSAEELSRMIKDSNKPFIITNLLEKWNHISQWTIANFVEKFGHLRTKFKLYPKRIITTNNKKIKLNTVPMETDCDFCEGTFKEFKDWLDRKGLDENSPLKPYDPEKYWCYCDYIYMKDLLPDYIQKDIDWSVFGFPKYTGKESTLWIGTSGSFTPCHQDTYGFNIVAQIFGCKRWILVSPEKSRLLNPSRIPYEESSIFSYADESVLRNEGVVVDLCAGESLYVPKHWWHYVESLTHSISINVWIEHESDKFDQLEESLVQLFAYFATSANSSHPWLNPNQRLPATLNESLSQLKIAVRNIVDDDITNEDLFNVLCDKTVLQTIIRVLIDKKPSIK